MDLLYVLVGAIVALLGWNKVKSIQLDNEREKVESLEKENKTYKDAYQDNIEEWERLDNDKEQIEELIRLDVDAKRDRLRKYARDDNEV